MLTYSSMQQVSKRSGMFLCLLFSRNSTTVGGGGGLPPGTRQSMSVV